MKQVEKWAAAFFLFSLFSLSCAPQGLRDPTPSPRTPPPPVACPVPYERMIVMTATQNKAMDAASGGVGGYSADDAAAEVVTAELLRRGCKVVERQALNAVLRELGFQQSGMVDQDTAVRAGRKIAGAEAIVIANVYNTSSHYHQGFQGGTGNIVVDIGVKMLDPSGMVYTVDMGVKMIDVQTAEVVWSENKSAQSAPGANTSHTELLRNLVSSLSFLPSPGPVVSSEQQKSERPPREPDPEVKQAQGMLKELGYDPGPIDGLMGKKTREALRQFQRAHGLTATGKLDKATMAALQQPPARSPGQPQQPSTNPQAQPTSEPVIY